MHWLYSMPIWLLAGMVFATLWLAAFGGRRLAGTRPHDDKANDPGLLVSSSLGLMALLLGFTVSMAVARYDQRRTAMVDEANAIGTFLYRTDLMPAGQRAGTLDALGTYVDARVRVGRQGEPSAGVAEARSVQAVAQGRIWQEVLATSAVAPDGSFRILIVGAANQMFDMATARDIALENRLPPTLVMLLILFPVASMVLIGYVHGGSIGAHLMASTEMILLLTLVLTLIVDLDRPRAGTILAPMEALLAVQDQLRQAQSAASPAVDDLPATSLAR